MHVQALESRHPTETVHDCCWLHLTKTLRKSVIWHLTSLFVLATFAGWIPTYSSLLYCIFPDTPITIHLAKKYTAQRHHEWSGGMTLFLVVGSFNFSQIDVENSISATDFCGAQSILYPYFFMTAGGCSRLPVPNIGQKWSKLSTTHKCSYGPLPVMCLQSHL